MRLSICLIPLPLDLATAALFGSFSYDFLRLFVLSLFPQNTNPCSFVYNNLWWLRSLGGLSGASSPLQGDVFVCVFYRPGAHMVSSLAN